MVGNLQKCKKKKKKKYTKKYIKGKQVHLLSPY